MTNQQYTYARFWKCALQVNPAGYAAAYRRQAHGLTGDEYLIKLLQVCREQDIRVVGLADHGSVQDVDAIRDFLLPQGIIVFPGFEISSTEKIHIVSLFAEDTTTEQLQRVLGRLDLMDPQERVTPSRLGCLEIARIIQERGGFWFAAHMTGGNGLLRLNQDGGGLIHVWKYHDLVRAGQIPGPIDDLPVNYKQIVTNKNSDYWRERPITVINAKDVARPDDLRDPRASTFIKMTRPFFASFLMAFKDPDSRVRLMDQMQERFYSQVEGIRIEGGYFDGLTAELSGHLNTVIGGRGTGKSTLLECLRYALDLPHKGEDARKQGDQIVKEEPRQGGWSGDGGAALRREQYEVLHRGRKILEALDETLRQKLGEIGKATVAAETALAALGNELKQALEQSEAQLENEFAKLPAVAGKGGKEIGRTYQRLLREIEQVKPAQARLKTVDALLKELEQTRRNLLGEISDIRSARTAAKQKAIKGLNKRLAGKLRITIVPDGLRQPLRTFLQGLPGVGERKTEWVDDAQDLTVMGLVAAIREGKNALLGKGWGLTSGLADALTRLTPAQLYALEAIDLEDRVSLKLNVSHAGERFRELERLSTGQQCTTILHLLLLDNPDPLIMDQPEDNLDNAFIADRIVQELRSAKTERQFLFATHNANIPVFGDAEWIGVCSASEDHAEMTDDAQGSIDIPAIRDQVASILEGGKEAFMQRKEKYGFDY